MENPDYLKRWSERLGFVNITPSGKDVLWVHAVSVGEVNASLPLLRSLITSYKTLDILVTTTTPTGSEILMRIASPLALVVDPSTAKRNSFFYIFTKKEE